MRQGKPQKAPQKTRRIAGIVAAAKALGVTRQHLRAVLAGRRKSASLQHRYEQYLAKNN